MLPIFESLGVQTHVWDRYKNLFKRVLKWVTIYAGLLLLITSGALALSVYNYFQIRELRAEIATQKETPHSEVR